LGTELVAPTLWNRKEVTESRSKGIHHGDALLGAIGRPIEVGKCHASVHGIGKGWVQRQVLFSADDADGCEPEVVTCGGRGANVVRVRSAERQQRPGATFRCRTKVVLQLSPLVAWHLGMDQIIPLQKDTHLVITK
jgi:hypothetical protein